MSRRSLARRWTYHLSRLLARLVGVYLFGLRCQGRENWPTSVGALVCANHQSFFDPVLVGLACNERMNYLARENLFRWAPFRWLIRWYDAIPIRRDGLGLAGLKETLRRLRRGEFVLIFPEGTRTRDGELGPIQPGFCAVARRGKVPLVPVGIDGAYACWPRTQRWPGRAPIGICVGEPIDLELIESLSDDELIAELAARMRQCHLRARRLVMGRRHGARR